MSARLYRSELDSNNTRGVEYCFTIQGNGAATPQFLEGDVNGGGVNGAGTYVTIARTGVGIYTLTTNDPFPGVTGYGFQFSSTALNLNANVVLSPNPTQNANNTWTFTINVAIGAVAHELAATEQLSCWLRFRNGLNNP